MPAAVTLGKPSGCRPWNAITTTNQGLLTLEELFEDHKTGKIWCDYTKNTKTCSPNGGDRITKTYDNGKSMVHEITLTYGLSLESTPNHKWFVSGRRENKKIIQVNQWIPTSDIKTGDIVQLTPNLYSNTENYKLQTLDSRALKMRLDSQDILQPEYMNDDLAWVLGYLWGDGAMSPGKFRIRFIDQHVYNLEKAQRILKEQFGLDSSLHKASEHRNAYTLDIASKMLWHWLIKNDVWKYFSNKLDLIPRCVRSSSKSSIISFIAGLIDSDGWCGFKHSKTATITTADKEFAKHLQHISWSVGICLGRSLNSRGASLQQRKEMYLMGLSAQTNTESGKILIRNSNKMTRLNEQFPEIRWIFENTNAKTLQMGEVVSNIEIGEKETFDIEVENSHEYYNGCARSHNTVSQLTNSSSGCHVRYSPYYIRRYRISSTDPLLTMLKDQKIPMNPEVGQRKHEIENWSEDKVKTWVLDFPIKSPDGAITRHDVDAIKQLEHYKLLQKYWCEHAQSCTIYVKDEEWFEVGNWVYQNWNIVNGISFLPYDGGIYELAPYEEISEEQYNELAKNFPVIDYSVLSQYEIEDNTEGAKSYACSGDVCELK